MRNVLHWRPLGLPFFVLLCCAMGSPAWASFHLMQIEQAIGGVNGDTSAQAIQLRMRSFGQGIVSASRLKIYDATGANPIIIKDFTTDVANGASGARILIASPNFAGHLNAPLTPDFTMGNLIPASYLAAGRLTFESDTGIIYWSLSFGGANYTGSTTGDITNDADGNFGPSFSGPLPSSGTNALLFQGAATAPSTSNAADYALTAGAATFTNNAGSSATISAPIVGTSLSINDITVNEGNSGTSNATFTVTLSAAINEAVTVDYATANGTATAGSDYNATSGTLTFFPGGDTTETITVPIIGDLLDEANETVRVNLSNASGAAISDNQGIGTIVDNDATPQLSINDVTLIEGNSGTTNATFNVSLSAVSGQTVSVNAIPSNGSAKAPGDYQSGGAALTFAPGQTSRTFSVPIVGDLLDEANETFFVILSSPVNAAIARGRGVGTIQDNDATPSISIDNLSIGEGNSGQRVAAFRLNLSAPSGQLVKVSFATAIGTATAGNDYVAVAPTQIAFTTGQSVAIARVLINGDVLNEPNETFLVNLTSPINATITDNQALGTILNDDRAPSISINDVQISEGNSGSTTLTFTVTLSAASGQNVSVNYATANGSALSTSDYQSTSGTLTFAPGSALTRTINVTINGDTLVEGNETLFILLSGATNSTIGKARGTGTILNDDSSG